ncbi:DUF4158 domain-containing protein [Streptomyces spectabilis]|uniref:DUF4158 domain-containing protein n=1 Tax=Streptomyces spectabilis TaxID=68270 RepID=A0A7W8B3W9_STRST|nr:DUF4158 domain-containing protein [Streptomyces spectabilis]MBB5109848.1 hypothetical protein [Streptomyces spectabilis]GGV56228.1 hypothetical protein GCM10010245_89120 [Streptomyces spectabilis]
MFLTDEQRHSYGTFTQVPDDGQLAGYFLLDRDAWRRAMACRGRARSSATGSSWAPYGFWVSSWTTPNTPAEVVEYVADQLGHCPSVLAGYGAERTRWDHRNGHQGRLRLPGSEGRRLVEAGPLAVGPVLVGQ